jgi:hypothetical protein
MDVLTIEDEYGKRARYDNGPAHKRDGCLHEIGRKIVKNPWLISLKDYSRN